MAFGREKYLPLSLPGEIIEEGEYFLQCNRLHMGQILPTEVQDIPDPRDAEGYDRFLSPEFKKKIADLRSNPTAVLSNIYWDKNCLTYGLYIHGREITGIPLVGMAEIQPDPTDRTVASLRIATWRPEFQRTGIGSTAVRGMVCSALNEREGGYSTVKAVAYAPNTTSVNLFRDKVGFTVTGAGDAEYPLPEDKAQGKGTKLTIMKMYHPDIPGISDEEREKSAALLAWGERYSMIRG